MPDIETTDDLAMQIADWIYCYGRCPAAEKGEDCVNDNPFCCRLGVMTWLPDRIRAAVENEKKLEDAGLAH